MMGMAITSATKRTMGVAFGALVLTAGAAALTLMPAQAGGGPKCDGKPATIVRGDGDNDIVGTNGNDVIVAGGGDDDVEGGLGNDRICGNGDNDNLDGDSGDDTLLSGGGRDFADGGSD